LSEIPVDIIEKMTNVLFRRWHYFYNVFFQMFEHTIFRTLNVSRTWPVDHRTGNPRFASAKNRCSPSWWWHVEHDLLAVRLFLVAAVSHERACTCDAYARYFREYYVFRCDKIVNTCSRYNRVSSELLCTAKYTETIIFVSAGNRNHVQWSGWTWRQSDSRHETPRGITNVFD
jgi:hypothetical protein